MLPLPPPSLRGAFTQTHSLPPMSYIYLHYREKKLMKLLFISATIQPISAPSSFHSSALTSGQRSRNYTSQKCTTKILYPKYHCSESPLNSVNYLIIYHILGLLLSLLICCLSSILVLPAQVELLLTILYVVGCHIIQAHRVILYFNV